jgi:hypothetical protein
MSWFGGEDGRQGHMALATTNVSLWWKFKCTAGEEQYLATDCVCALSIIQQIAFHVTVAKKKSSYRK